jgi:hypothetical protein
MLSTKKIYLQSRISLGCNKLGLGDLKQNNFVGLPYS